MNNTCICCGEKSIATLCLGCETGRNRHCATCRQQMAAQREQLARVIDGDELYTSPRLAAAIADALAEGYERPHR